MFVVSLSSKKLGKTIGVALAGIVILCAVLSIGLFDSASLKSSLSANGPGFKLEAEDAEQRLEFISQFGWVVDKAPVEVRDVVIPEAFDDVYKNYNSIQLSQGLDLKPFAGATVKRWTYTIKNYPDYPEGTDYIRINMLVYNGKVIGGDVCSLKLDGFMHGFEKE